jgi:ferredoxin-NADP reductase
MRRRNVVDIRISCDHDRYVEFDILVDRDPHNPYPTLTNARPGQYVIVTCEDARQHCVIMKSDDTAGSLRLTFMVKQDSRLAHELARKRTADISHPAGGFDVADRDVMCFAGGSGIAAIVPVLHMLRSHDRGRNLTKLFYSERVRGTHINIDELDRQHVHLITSEEVMSGNPNMSMLELISSLSGIVPITYPIRPIVYAAGPKGFVDRLQAAFMNANHVIPGDFRVNF